MAKQDKAPKLTAAQKAKAASDAHKTIARNKKALHDYAVEEKLEAGLALTGTEVKALRMGRASLVDAWVELGCRARTSLNIRRARGTTTLRAASGVC